MIRCEAEMCRNWTGQGCACEFLGMEPNVVREDGDEDDGYGCCDICGEDLSDGSSHYHCPHCGVPCSSMGHHCINRSCEYASELCTACGHERGGHAPDCDIGRWTDKPCGCRLFRAPDPGLPAGRTATAEETT